MMCRSGGQAGIHVTWWPRPTEGWRTIGIEGRSYLLGGLKEGGCPPFFLFNLIRISTDMAE